MNAMTARKALTRRGFLCAAATSGLAAWIAACSPPTPSEPSQPTQVAATTAPEATQAPPTAAPSEAPTANPDLGGLELPIVNEPLTLTYFAQLNSNAAATMKSYNEIAAYQVAEERTGIHLEFQHPPTGSGQAQEQFNLMLASGKYPDIIEWKWLGFPGGPAKAIRDGIILRLNDLIAQHAPNLSRILAEHPDWRKQVVTDEGDMYVFPSLYGSRYILTFSGLAIRGDWLEKLGLPVPTTIDEWHTMLKAFKEQDPNGNGQADEIPFSPTMGSDSRGGFDSTHAFVGAWGITMGFYQEGGVVKYGALQPEFKEFLRTMAAWYQEGLIDPEYVSTDSKLMDAKVTGGQMGSLITYMGSGIGKYMGLMKDQDPNFKLIGAPYPVLVAGDKPQLGQKDFDFPGTGAAITTANKHVEETVKRLDYPFSPEGHMLFNFGIEGVSYKMVDGYPTYTDEILKNPQGLPMGQAMARYCRANFATTFVQDPRYLEQYAALPVQKEALEVWGEPSNEKLMPPVTPTEEESARSAAIMNDVNTLYSEMLHKVITGALPVDGWDGVVQQLKQMGIEEAIAIQQAALERYNRR